MRWQPIVRFKFSTRVALCLATSFFLVRQSGAAGLELPPLVIDAQSSSDTSEQRPCRYTGDFTQERQLEELDSALVSSGSFMFSCDTGLLWEVRKPIFDARVYSADNLSFRIQRNEKVTQLFGIGQTRTARLLLDLLGGNTSALSEDFDLASADKSSDDKLPDSLVFRPKQKFVQKSLTQLIVQQQGDTVTITLQAPAGDSVIKIDNIAVFQGDDLAECEQFSELASPACSVLTTPADFVSTFDSTR